MNRLSGFNKFSLEKREYEVKVQVGDWDSAVNSLQLVTDMYW